ncbi:MAG TPA: DUF1801 domain-containing protein [Candidatus Saccharimonadales bacterium]|nr:DUF1801 domain-containing protein [Candidatus Saccharimonadales bacterium]
MAELKTKVTGESVTDFLNKVSDETKRKDSFTLLKIFEEVTHEKAKMWGSAIVGFGQYHYKSERSSQEGDWPLVGFSPRKAALTLYLMLGLITPDSVLIAKLGKHKTSKGCLYINKLSDIDESVLRKLIKQCVLEKKKEIPLLTSTLS